MGLRCLLGHDFDEPETERERNEEGNEVVVTVREVKTCNRCGEKQVVSENKEITSIDQLRESATGEPSTDVDAGTESADDGWGTDELSTPADSGVDAPGGDAVSDDTATAAGSGAPSADSDQTAGVDAEDDSIDRGVADIIEQAEKDDDMLAGSAKSEPEPEAGDTGAESGDAEDEDVPVHPSQRGGDDEESEAPDPERDDGVILDEEAESQPEEARRQWEEEASPEEVPGKDPAVPEPDPEAPDGEDAEIIDGDAVSDQPSTEPESDPEPSSEPTASDADRQPTETHSAVESEDAEIMDAGPENPDPEPERRSDEPEGRPGEAERQSEPASSEREETEDGHMPWPDAPGEDEGHDATEPDGEPADVEFGGGLTPSDPGADDEESAPAEVEPSGSIDRIEDEDDRATTEPDRANGHRTEDGESDDTSATPTANVNLERSTRDANMEYYCPECGLTRDVGNSSMRAGDICPDCRQGYITEQQKAE